MQQEILKVNLNDLEAILALQKECYISEAEIYNDFDIPPLKQDLQSLEKEFKSSLFLKCIVNGEIVGSVRGYSDNHSAYIGKLIVRKDFQNKGIGTNLLNAIEASFNDFGRFELFTGHRSQKNLFLYKKLGYREFKQEVINEGFTMIFLEKIR